MAKGGEQVVQTMKDPFPGAHGVEEVALARPAGVEEIALARPGGGVGV